MFKKVSPELFHQFLENKIIQHNKSKVSVSTNSRYNDRICYAYEKNFKYKAGISIECYWGIMHINYLWVDESLRGKKIGKELLSFAEKLAIDKNCMIIYLETFSFQAPEFYKKNGFEEFGKLNNIPDENSTLYFMKKNLKG
ncbi:TPA: GNAT family N-acetyltransferase [Enterococcus faecalis]